MILRSSDKSVFVIIGRGTGVKVERVHDDYGGFGIYAFWANEPEGVLLEEYETKKDALNVIKQIYSALTSDEFMNFDLPSPQSMIRERRKEEWRNRPDELSGLNLSVRTYNCLHRVDIRSLAELRGYSEDELRKIRNLGPTGIREINELLAQEVQAYDQAQDD